LVLQVQADEGASRRALEDLCRLYWDPLYAFVRRSGFGREDAEDLVQEFLARVLERRLLDHISAEKGKLRSWLLALLKPFLNDRRKHDRRLKRGGAAQVVSIDAAEAERRYNEQPVQTMRPDALFERRWGISVLAHALSTLGEEYAQLGRGELFAEIRVHLQWQGDGDRSYAKSAVCLGMRVGAIKVAVHRLRRRYAEVLRREVAETLGPDEDVDAEIRYLFTLFSND
jgi:RNA polymerase sigma-70 factor (ECF subfamily)